MKKFVTVCLLMCFIVIKTGSQETPVYLDISKDIDSRVNDLIARLTLEEKVMQMMYESPAIDRLQIPNYNWWNECLHGVARSGVATVFPQAIGIGATFDEELVFRVATAISDEARAMYNAFVEKNIHMQYGGLTFWTPNINIFRDPRWGRGQETYGEDPFLTAQLGSALVRGLQGDHSVYLKVAACAKHFAVHSGPEKLRHEFNAVASPKDLYETYLPAFKALVEEGVETVMCAYNSTNGDPCCANNYLLNEVLRKEWGFKGHIVSDCWALNDFYEGHKVTANKVESAALALKNGVNLNCGNVYPFLVDAVKQGLVQEKEIDASLAILLKTRFRLGLFDPRDKNPYFAVSQEMINCNKHRQLAREAATKSIVMLKNNGVLPLPNNLNKYYITGPNATSIEALLGNYYGISNHLVTFLEGIASQIMPGSQLQYKPGCLLDRENINPIDWTTGDAKASDVTIVVLGLTGLLEGEEGESIASEYFGDRLDYNIPINQVHFLKKVREGNDHPIIAVITGGCPMNLAEVHKLADAVLLVWYPGEEGGNALADILFGNVSPSGKLPVTFPQSLDQLPPFEDYNMEGRTYRYMKLDPMYPFGFGLSYCTFKYSPVILSSSNFKKGGQVKAEINVTNTGKYIADEVVQLYISSPVSDFNPPLFSLKGIQRITLKPGETRTLQFVINEDMLSVADSMGKPFLGTGDYKIYIGGSLPVKRSLELGAEKPSEFILTVK